MATRNVDGPGQPDCPTVTTEEAARYLGVSTKQFGRMVGTGRRPHKAELPGARSWVQPVRRGSDVRWHWLTITYLEHLLNLGVFSTGEEDDDDDPPEVPKKS